MSKLLKGACDGVYVHPTQDDEHDVFHITDGGGESDISNEVKNLLLIEEALAEINLKVDEKEFLVAFSKMTVRQKAVVIDFALAVQEGEASVGVFVHRLQGSERVRNWRDQMPPEEAAEYRAKQAERVQNWRNRRSPEEVAEQRAKEAERARQRRAQMSPEEVAERRAKAAAYQRMRRAGPTIP